MTIFEIETISDSDRNSSDEEVEYSFFVETPNSEIYQKSYRTLRKKKNEKVEDNEKIEHNKKNVKNKKFHDFLQRQNSANSRQTLLRKQEPVERPFDPPEEPFILKSAIPPQREKVILENNIISLYYRSIHQRNDDRNSKENTYHDCNKAHINSNSIMMVNRKQRNIIFDICGNQDIINNFQFEKILRSLSIKKSSTIAEITSIVKIEEDKFDNKKLKYFLLNTMNKASNLSLLEQSVKLAIQTMFKNNKLLKKQSHLNCTKKIHTEHP